MALIGCQPKILVKPLCNAASNYNHIHHSNYPRSPSDMSFAYVAERPRGKLLKLQSICQLDGRSVVAARVTFDEPCDLPETSSQVAEAS